MPVSIIVTDLNGRLVLEKKAIAMYRGIELDLSDKPKGVYFIKVDKGNGTTTKKLLVL